MVSAPRILLAAASVLSLSAQSEEPAIPKDSISVHTVRQGSMPVRWRGAGTIESVVPPKAVLTPLDGGSEPCKTGQRSSVQIEPRKILTGRVVRVLKGENAERSRCEVELSDALPAGVSVSKEVNGLIEVGEIRDAVYFERPADSSANSDALVFVIEPGDEYARRVSVRYGELSGPLIQILSGLSAGDRVIVTDMSQWRAHERVRLK
jgi:hypothetical protein